MSSLFVIEHFNVFEQILLGLSVCMIILVVYPLRLQCAEETYKATPDFKPMEAWRAEFAQRLSDRWRE